MSNDDPFANPDADRTVILPTPRSRTAAETNERPREFAAPAPADDAPPVLSGLNPLLALANPLLDIVPQLRTMPTHNDPTALRDQLAQGIRLFESRAKKLGLPAEMTVGARYCLCTLIDETAASTPWGGSGIWAGHSLLVMFHNETWGGEKFFLLLAKLLENPKANRHLLELMYACIALGLEGRYRVVDNGRTQLDALRRRLSGVLREERGEYERDLSGHWRPARTPRATLVHHLPLWTVAAGCALLLFLVYLTFNLRLNAASDPVYQRLQSIRVGSAPPPPPPPPAPEPRLGIFLEPEIRAGLVAVRDEANRSVVTLRGDNLFAPGSAAIEAAYLPLLERIAAALNRVPGAVQITGHTDNKPIRSARFPSNWHLSQERAKNVLDILAARAVPAGRFSAEGRADAEPVAGNDTPEGRSRNRRVDITLFVAPAAAPGTAAP